MVIAATNDGPAFVKARALSGDGGDDPFDLKNTMREFRMQMGASKSGGGRICELSLIAPSASAENKLLSFLGKNREENCYEFEWGWEGGGKSDKVLAQFVNVDYTMNLGSEIAMKVTFAVTDNQIKNSLSGKKATKTRRVSSLEPEKGLGETLGELIATVCKVPGMITAVHLPKSFQEGINSKMEAFADALKNGWKPSSKEGGDGKPGNSEGAETYNARDIPNVNEGLAKDEAMAQVLAESPFSYRAGTGNRRSDPSSPEGQLNSLWGGDRRDAADNPWDRYGRDYDNSPLVGQSSFSLDMGDPFDVLLGGEGKPLDANPTHPDDFIPSIPGASESMESFSSLRSGFNSQVNFFEWERNYPGQIEYWVRGEAPRVIQEQAQSNLATWARDEQGAWDSFIPSLAYVSKFCKVIGDGASSPNIFEIPPQDEETTDAFGPGVWMFRLSNEAVADITLHVSRQSARLDVVDGLNSLEFMPPPQSTATTTGPYGDGQFLYNSSPFDSGGFMYSTAGDGGGSDSAGDGGSDGGKKTQVVLAIKEGEDIESWLGGVITWVNELVTEGDMLSYRIYEGADIGKELKKAVQNPMKGKLYLVIAPLKDMGTDESNIKSQSSFPWIGKKDLNITVGGWQSIVEGLNVNTTVVAAVPSKGQVDQGKLKSKGDAESGAGGDSAQDKNKKEVSKGDITKGARAVGSGQVDKAASEVTKDDNDNPSANAKEVKAAKDQTGSVAPKTAEASNKKKKSDAAKAKSTLQAVNWGNVAFKVTVTCLGLPEISGVNEIARNVNLDVPDIRGGSGSHGLSGNYMIVDYEHVISTDQGFKTKLVLFTKTGNEFTS